MKIDGSDIDEKSSFKMLGLTFSSKLDWGSYIISIAMKFFLLRLLCISVNLPFGHTLNAVVTFDLVLLIATWNCWIGYQNIYAGLLVLHLLLLLNLWHIIKMKAA